ncbi:MAG: hypothetical protein AB7M05_18115 [Alphaproteobacteria bacterium]
MTDDTRGPDGLWRKGHSGNPDTMFKPGDPDNPRTRQKRERAGRGKEPSAAAALRREEMRAELVALDVMERLVSGARDTTLRRLPRLPEDPKAARREAKRLAARSKARALRAMQRIARDPNEAPEVRLAIVQMLLQANGAAAPDDADRGGRGAKKEPKVIVVNRYTPRSPWMKSENQPETPHPGGTAAIAPPPAPAVPPSAPPARATTSVWDDILRREAEELRARYDSPEDD